MNLLAPVSPLRLKVHNSMFRFKCRFCRIQNNPLSSRSEVKLRFIVVVSFLLGSISWLHADSGDQAPPTKAVLQRQAAQCRDTLKSSVIDFYLSACVDNQNGGYLEWFEDGKFVAKGQKFLTLQARQLWFFSTIAERGIEKEAALAAARTGFQFLQNKFCDRQYGGYYAMVTDTLLVNRHPANPDLNLAPSVQTAPIKFQNAD